MAVIWHGNEAYVSNEYVGRVARAPKTEKTVRWLAWVIEVEMVRLGAFPTLGEARSAVEARVAEKVEA